jgi:UDP-glucose:(heptosyl)LPS alpha-1,3-glucosyltransferase
MERGVPGTIYRAGDGVHKVWMKIKYQNSVKWVFNPINWILPYLEKISIEQSKCVVPNSSMVKSEIVKHYKISCEKIVVIHNGYDPSIYYPLGTDARLKLRSKLGMDNNDLNLLFAGSGWERKDLYWLLKFFSFVLSQKRNSVLWVAGKGKNKKILRLSSKLGINQNIKYLGIVKNIEQLYQVFDFMILPTLYDPFSNSCLEAIACGCDVLTTEKNGISEILNPINIIKRDNKNENQRILDIIFDGKRINNRLLNTEEIELNMYLDILR